MIMNIYDLDLESFETGGVQGGVIHRFAQFCGRLMLDGETEKPIEGGSMRSDVTGGNRGIEIERSNRKKRIKKGMKRLSGFAGKYLVVDDDDIEKAKALRDIHDPDIEVITTSEFINTCMNLLTGEEICQGDKKDSVCKLFRDSRESERAY